ncbi:PTS transporter subunit EIIC [Mycoplasmopsis cynos]|nr:PTS transporter subunit EIIC [Mycoplasmopsis cynos]WAM05052.1 PTS transporter subunit EIIC [Mycoplasmopsis cynos]
MWVDKDCYRICGWSNIERYIKWIIWIFKNAIASSGVADPDKFLGTGSGFIGGIFGAFFAAAMVIVFSKYIFGKLPKSLQGIKNILFIPLFGTLTIAVLFWIVNIALIFINLGLVLFLQIFENRRELAWILGLILGAMMELTLVDQLIKRAYIFGTLTIANGHSTISMAALLYFWYGASTRNFIINVY